MQLPEIPNAPFDYPDPDGPYLVEAYLEDGAVRIRPGEPGRRDMAWTAYVREANERMPRQEGELGPKPEAGMPMHIRADARLKARDVLGVVAACRASSIFKIVIVTGNGRNHVEGGLGRIRGPDTARPTSSATTGRPGARRPS